MVLSVAMRPSNEALLKTDLLLKQGGLRVEEMDLRREGDVLTGRIVVTGKEVKARWFVEKARTLPFFVSADLGA
jgi:hypothetical protein